MAHEGQLLNVLIRQACRRIDHLQLHPHKVVHRAFGVVRTTRRRLLLERLRAAAECFGPIVRGRDERCHPYRRAETGRQPYVQAQASLQVVMQVLSHVGRVRQSQDLRVSIHRRRPRRPFTIPLRCEQDHLLGGDREGVEAFLRCRCSGSFRRCLDGERIR